MDFKEGTTLEKINENEYYPINFGLFKDIFNDDTEINILIDKYNKNCENDGLKLKIKSKKKWVIEFPHKIIYNYIKKQVKDISKIINNILKFDKGINSIILIGGYCSSQVLVSEMKNQLSNKISYFLKPSNPCLSIMEGAVLFGFNPKKIVQRKAKYTIGLNLIDYWKETIHSKNGEKYYDEERKDWFCKDCFLIFIKINEVIELGQEITKNLNLPSSRYGKIILYKTLKINPIFVHEDGIEEIGRFIFDAGKDYPLGERDCTVTMRIGGTFIDVKAKHLKSGKTIKSKLDFY